MMNRRESLAMMGKLALAGAATPLFAAENSKSPKRRCRPVISGPLWSVNPAESVAWGTSGWRDELEAQRKLHFDLLWLANTPAALAHNPDALTPVMDLCAERQVQVILDCGSSQRWYSPFDLANELAVCGRNIARIGARFRGHPAFHAWYIPHEIYRCWGEFARYIEGLYSGLVERCKLAADLPVTLSPFFILDRDKVFGDFQFAEPDDYRRYWAALIRRSRLDVIMLQDSGEHFSYVTNEQRRPFFEAMSAACQESGVQFWANVETAEFECPSLEEYVRRYGRVHHTAVKDAPWRPVPIRRLAEKLGLAAEFSQRIVTWGYREYCRPALGPKGKAWHNAYRRYVEEVRR